MTELYLDPNLIVIAIAVVFVIVLFFDTLPFEQIIGQ
jgi:nitrogen fixation-related uncharacterized protein